MEELKEIDVGDQIEAAEYNKLVQRANEGFSAQSYHEDDLGRVIFSQNPTEQVVRVAFTLTEDMGNTTSGEASCTIHRVWDASTEDYTTGTEAGVVRDPGDVFSAALNGAYGKGWLRQGNGRQVIDPIVISC